MSALRRPKIGLIVPPAGGRAPPECTALYAGSVDFLVADAALKALDLESYSEAEARLPALAAGLSEKGAEAVVLMGTSMSFHGGRAHARALEQMIADASGRPSTSMSAAIIGALKAVGGRRIALATAYVDEVNDALIGFLAESGIEITALEALDIHEVAAIAGIGDERLIALGRNAYRADESADALLISCGGLQTLGITPVLEQDIGKPVVSSAVAGAWAAGSIAGIDVRRCGYGALLQTWTGLQSSLISQPVTR